jgi:hypothetical protein
MGLAMGSHWVETRTPVLMPKLTRPWIKNQDKSYLHVTHQACATPVCVILPERTAAAPSSPRRELPPVVPLVPRTCSQPELMQKLDLSFVLDSLALRMNSRYPELTASRCG